MTEEEISLMLKKNKIEYNECRNKMNKSLINTKNYFSKKEYTDKQREEIREYNNNQTQEYRNCAMKVKSLHAEAVFNACEKHGCGENIGGGCSHIAEYSIYSSVSKAAQALCAHNKSFQSDR